MAVETVYLTMEQIVSTTDVTVPVTGVWSSETDGWIHDRTRFIDSLDTQHSSYSWVGGWQFNQDEGSVVGDWQSGAMHQILFDGISLYPDRGLPAWVPRVLQDQYSFGPEQRLLYSDYSFQGLEQTTVDTHTEITLRDDCLDSTIDIAVWERTAQHLIRNPIYRYVDEFTGIVQAEERLDPVDDDGNIGWEEVSDRHHEFMIQDRTVLLNRDARMVIGTTATTPTVEEVLEICEDQGVGPGVTTGRYLYTRHFPLQTDTVRVFVLSEDQLTYTELTRVDAMNEQEAVDETFSVDPELGQIQLGGYLAPALHLQQDITDTDTVLRVFAVEEFDEWPAWGVLIIGAEHIYYDHKGHYTFEGLVRGYEATAATAHVEGDEVTGHQRGASYTGYQAIRIAYTAIPMIRYEVSASSTVRTANKTPWVDVSPSQNIYTNNILQIVSEEQQLERIVLTCDADPEGGNEFSGVQFGLDSSLVTATALDKDDDPIDGIELTIEILSGPGVLNDAPSYSGMTNSIGQIYALYSCPFDSDGIAFPVTNVGVVGAETTMTAPGIDGDTDPEAIICYQILKHDPSVGTVGDAAVVLTAATATGGEDGNTKIKIDRRLHESYFGGTMRVIGTDTVTYTFDIVGIYDIVDGGGELRSTVHFSDTTTAPDRAALIGQTAYFILPGAEEWDAAELNGVEVILYRWSTEVLHPLTGAVGAYAPFRPTEVNDDEVVFNLALPVPDPDDDGVNLGGYILAAPTFVTMRARGVDPISGVTIYSNTIRIALSIPNQVTGVDDSGALPIPYGFKLVTEDFNVGSMIGFGNFLTVNPAADGLGIFTGMVEI